jgi:hypothetical protein
MMGKKKIAVVLISIILSLCVCIIAITFLLRNVILNTAIKKVQHKLSADYNLNFSVAEAKFISYTTVELNKIVVLSPLNDTLCKFDQLIATPDVLSWMRGSKSFNRFEVNNGLLSLIKKKGYSNFEFLFNKKNAKQSKVESESTYETILNTLIDKISETVPARISVNNFRVDLQTDNYWEEFNFKSLTKADDQIDALFESKKHLLQLKGNLNKEFSKGNLYVIADHDFKLPFIDSLMGVSLALQKIHLDFERKISSQTQFTGVLEASGVRMFHPRLSDDTILIESGSVLFNAHIKDNFIELDSSSYARINKVTTNIYASYNKDNRRNVKLKCKMEPINASSFFNSLPPGLFNHIRSIEAEGNLAYAVNLDVCLDAPDSIKFMSAMKGIDLKIRSFGKTNLNKLNSAFTYTAFEKGKPVKSFVVGPQNPDFVPLGGISNYIQKAILTSEDGAFFWHKGFNEEAIAKSIATNLKEGKFKRGGSTISMQLVKNVFLTRKKTLSRKLEEILITWIIENQRVSSKERMFEVYLNVIEYGPMLYGIGPACMFYFGKRPCDITLNEAIFLSSLLPHPKWFKYSFDKDGNLKAYLADYFRFMGKVMFGRKLISENEYNDLKPTVDLYRDAQRLLNPDIDINPDSLDLVPNE